MISRGSQIIIILHRLLRSELLYILIAGGIIRISLASTRSFFGDEAATLHLICLPVTYLLSHFDLWLTMNVFLVVEKIIARCFGEGLVTMRLISIIADLGSIATIYFLSGRLFPKIPQYMPTLMFAANPHAIDFSATARVYSLFVFLALLMLLAFLRWQEWSTALNRWVFSIICGIMVLFHLGGIVLVLWAGIMVCTNTITSLIKERKNDKVYKSLQLFSTLALCLSPAGILYGRMWQQIREHNLFEYTGVNFSFIKQATFVFKTFMGIETPAMTFLYAGMLVIGLLHYTIHTRRARAWHMLWLGLPFVISKAAGYSYPPHYLARFIVFALPIVILLLCWGISVICSLAPSRIQRWLMAICISGIIVPSIPKTKSFFDAEKQFPYYRVANFLKNKQLVGDKVVCDNFFTFLHLSCYFPCSNRLFATHPVSLNSVIEKNLEIHLKNHNGSGRMFLVIINPSLLHCGIATETFGKITIIEFPEENFRDRCQRLRICLTQDLPDIRTGSFDCTKSCHYELLQQICTAEGDSEAALAYKDASKQCYEKMEQRLLKKFGATPKMSP